MKSLPMPTLARLIAPVSVEEFLADYFEKKPLLVKRGRADYHADVVTLDEVDRVITTAHLKHGDILMANAAKAESPTNDYVFPSDLVDVVGLFNQYRAGSSVVLNGMQSHIPSLSQLCRGLEVDLNHRFQANLYLTPPNAQGFRSHYDSHDVICLQVHGSKKWVVYDAPVELPLAGQGFNAAEHKVGPVSMEFDLEPGDTFYCPRGVTHDASTAVGDSLHVTIGVNGSTWTQLMIESMARVALRDPRFRKDLPPGYVRPDFDRAEARAFFRDLVQRFAELADVDDVLDHFAEDLLSTRHALLPGQFRQIVQLRGLTVDSKVAQRPHLLYHLREEGDQVALAVYTGTLRLPKRVSACLRYALAHKEFHVRDLPDELDADGKVVLVDRLVREGVLHVV